MHDEAYDDATDALSADGIGLIDGDFDAWHEDVADILTAFLDPEEA